MTVVSEPARLEREERSTVERIRQAALTSFAAHGTSATTLRAVASAAGVSLGLVQHHFVTKAGLIAAVDEYVLDIVVSSMTRPSSTPPVVDSVAERSGRIFELFASRPHIADYVGRALVDGSPLGVAIFDTLLNDGLERWQRRAERGETRPGVDLTWAAINSMMLALGTISLRAHIDRQLPEPLTTPPQLKRWLAAGDELLREGLFRRPDGD
jgi:AcrR family transcriptional regulator